MQFVNLKALILLWLVPALILFFFWAFREKDRLLRVFCPEGSLLQRLTLGLSRRRRVSKAALLITAVALSLLALARPQLGFQWEEVKRKGVDIVVALDVSRSMMAQDVDPNRLERAKREITDLLRMLEGDRIALVAFAGSSFVQCPLTTDYGALEMFLDALSPDLIPVPGTALAQALRTCMGAFDKKQSTSKAIILITDGEDHEGNPMAEAEKAKDQAVKIFTIGIGSREGAPIPLAGASGGFKKDQSGELVLSRMDPSVLEEVALATGGTYVQSVSGDMDLKTIYLKGIRQGMEQTELASRHQKKWTERYQWPLLGAVLCLLIEGFLAEAKREGAA